MAALLGIILGRGGGADIHSYGYSFLWKFKTEKMRLDWNC